MDGCNYSEGKCEEGEVVGCVRESCDCLGLNDGNERVKCLWVRVGER